MVKKRCDPASSPARKRSDPASPPARLRNADQERERAPRDHKLARAISDANWGELVRQLEYKAEWYGQELITLDRYFPSSKRCSNCGHVVEKLPLNIREWNSPECGSHHDRDINAAINILAAGLAVSAPVAHGGDPQDRAGLSVEQP
ncbi:RNA-guided endonuclease TnpB family protein [Dapis sp. BLCC M172]|uniref:RNA-guided endonuclease TnpB family protein n=1 Tax=Dapis sp. BLCC M172 TaxID=2975281 RepID=UPI003CFB5B4F